MTCLASAAYDPASVVSKSTASNLAMTALDTTNLRLTFTAPATGNVLVRMRGVTAGASTFPRILLGVLDGATLRGRCSPAGGTAGLTSASQVSQEATYVIGGLTPGNSYTWDAAYGVELLIASSALKYGGPNDNAGSDAFGAFIFEIWDAWNLLAGTFYDPTTAATAAVTTSLLAMTALDTTNLRLTFTAPASGKVAWRIQTNLHGSTTQAVVHLGILESTTVVARAMPFIANPQALGTSSCVTLEASGVISGVSAGSHTYDAAYAVQVVGGANSALKWGGPNDTTSNNAFGGFAFSLWSS